MRKKWYLSLFGKRSLIFFLLVLQIALFVWLIESTSIAFKAGSQALNAISIIAAIYVVSEDSPSGYKVTWIFLILALPLFGGVMYILVKSHLGTRKFIKHFGKNDRYCRVNLKSKNLLPSINSESGAIYTQARYLESAAGFPIYTNTEVKYYPLGERMYSAMLEDMKNAHKYIFLEYYIIAEGEMWSGILEVLKAKVKEGVDVRIIYDDFGSWLFLPKDYCMQMRALGIKCHIFNKFRPVLTSVQNNRDHRKIIAIDGNIAYTGGVNIGDEYINKLVRFGHWKDTGVRLHGDGAWSFSAMFLTMWQFLDNVKENYEHYLPDTQDIISDGFVQPFCDSPLDVERVGEQAYLHMIYAAREYIYITTPYLMIDDAMIDALTLAAKSGIDVRIITPHIPDKWFVHYTTRSFYRKLIGCGVKVFEYTPGFMHSKTIVTDDYAAIVGTINLDYRSMNLQFECATAIYNMTAARDVSRDFLSTQERSQQITRDSLKQSWLTSIIQQVLRLFAPLM